MLRVANLTVLDEQGNKLLDDVSFTLHANEVVAVLGPNGAGKTTLLRCLFGAIEHYSGKIYINGLDLALLKGRQRALQIAAVSQEMPADFQLNVKTILETGRTPHQHWLNSKDDNAKRIIASAVDTMHLTKYLERDFSKLSGGEKKRVMICRALIQEPSLLVLDEPCNHLDIEHQLQLMSQLSSIAQSTLVSLHDFTLAAKYCDRVLVLNNGQLISDGKPAKVLDKELFEQVFSVHVEPYLDPWQQWSCCAASIPKKSLTAIREKPLTVFQEKSLTTIQDKPLTTIQDKRANSRQY
ncbi:ABC transporter ATP-binding protein [Gammaproteobacteria bacterium AS21]